MKRHSVISVGAALMGLAVFLWALGSWKPDPQPPPVDLGASAPLTPAETAPSAPTGPLLHIAGAPVASDNASEASVPDKLPVDDPPRLESNLNDPAPLSHVEDWRTSPRLWSFTPEDQQRITGLLDAMAKAIQERRWHDMRELRDQIEALGEVAVGPLLEVLLRDPDVRLQIYAASLLGDLQEKVPQGMLTEALRVYALPVLEGVASSDMPPHLRHGALIALGNVGNSGSVAFLLETLRQAESDILAMSAAHALGRIRDEDIQGTLTALVDRESDPAVRKLLVMALNQRPDPEMKSFLSDLARQDFDTQVRIEAVEGLGALDTPEADHVLREIVRGLGRSEVRTAAIDGLGRPGEEANLPFLKRILRSSDNPGMRNEAYLSIQDIGTPGAKAIIEDYQPGARVEGIIPGTQAEALGLAPDDVITDYDGKPVTGPTDLQILAKETPADRLVALVVHRDGRSTTYAIHGDFIGVNISPGAVID